jgi:hypothetical protein
MTGVAGRVTVGILALSGALVLAQAPAAPPPGGAPAGQAATPPPGAAAQAPAQSPAAPAKPPAGTITGTPANDTARGASLLAEARKALGGDDKFKNVKTLEVKGKSARAQQQQTLQGDFEIQIELPDKYRRKEALGLSDINVDITQLVNGENATQNAEIGGAQGQAIGGFDDGGGGNRGGNRGRGGRGNDIVRFLTGGGSDDPEQQAKIVRAQMTRMIMALLMTSPDPVAWIGVAESPDGRADVLQFKTADGVETRLLLDAKTHLPLMMAWQGTVQSFNRGNFQGQGRGGNFPQDQAPNQGRRGGNGNRGGGATVQQATLQMHVSDYKTVNGIKFPFLIQSGANEETTEELVVKNIRINPSFKPEQFAK